MFPVTTPAIQGSQGCTFTAASLIPPETIEEGVNAIERVLAKDLLCMHDVEVLNHTYLALDRLEKQGNIPKRNSSTALKMIVEKVDAFKMRYDDPQSKISLYYLKRFSAAKLPLPDRSSMNELIDELEVTKDFTNNYLDKRRIASHLCNCGTEEEFDNDVKALIRSHIDEEIEAIIYDKKEQFRQLLEKEKKIEAIREKWFQNGSSCVCPLTLGLITDPVLDEHGHCFERRAIMPRLKTQPVCPIKDKPLTEDQLLSNDVLKIQIETYKTQGFSMKPSERKDVPKPLANVRYNDKMASSYLSSAQELERKQHFQEAEQFYSQMLDHTSKSEDYTHLPSLFEKKGEKERAAAAYVVLADLQKAEGKLEEEIVSLQKSLTLASKCIIKERLAIILFQKGQKEIAAQLYLELARQAFYNRNKIQAERCCGEVLKMVPGCSEAWKLMAAIKINQAAEILLKGAEEISMPLKERIGLCKMVLVKDPTQILARLIFLELDRINAKNKISQLKERVKLLELAPNAFGKAQWEKYYGDVGVEPPLPENIYEFLNSSCPFWENKKVYETHVLVLVPQTLNGEPLTLKTLGQLDQKQGYTTKGDFSSMGNYDDQPAQSHWALFTRTVIEGSRNKLYEDMQAVLTPYNQKNFIDYEIPTVLDVAVCNFMEHVRSGSWLYGDNPLTFTWCQDNIDKGNLVVGGGSGKELIVGRASGAREERGVGGLSKFF